jgi:hypothetical protein
MCPHSTIYVSSYYYVCVLMLLHMRPNTTKYESSCYCVLTLLCVLMLLYMLPHTTTDLF